VNGLSMGSFFSVDYSFSSDFSEDIRAILDSLENSYSVRVEDSCLYKINSALSDVPVSLTEDEYAAFSRAFALITATKGAFDPSVYPLVSVWGFVPPYDTVVPPSSEAIETALSHCDIASFSLLEESRSIVKSDSSAMLDFGAVMKGYAAESVRDFLLAKGVRYALVDVGGTIAAVGKDSRIGVRPPRESKDWYVLSFILNSGEICATSGDYERYFDYEGTRYHHILDPKTGCPASSDVISATVIASDGLMADAFATAAVVLGSEKALRIFSSYQVRAIIITVDKKVICHNVDVSIKDTDYVLR